MSNTKDNIQNELFSMQSILNGFPGIAIIVDSTGNLMIWNKNAELVLGYTKEEILKMKMSDFHEPDVFNKIHKKIKKTTEDGKGRSIEYNLVTKSGKKIPYISSGSLLVVNGMNYIIGISTDISQLKETEKKLNNKIIEIKELKNQLQSENLYLQDIIERSHSFTNISGNSKLLISVFNKVKQVALTNSTVLIKGEIGTRKELFARAIHNLSSRRNRPFVRINCVTISDNWLESEFFGHVKGAFINADSKQIGKFDVANHGTLLIDEINEIPLQLQSKILIALQNKSYSLMGSSKIKPLDIRVIITTNYNLETLIKKKKILKELYFYINTFPIIIPPLRERKSDLPLIINVLINQLNLKFNKNITTIPKKIMKLLLNYSWPGNVRELENIIERAVILSKSSILKVEHLIDSKQDEKEINLPLIDFEKKYIIKILNQTFWRVAGEKGAAKILDLNPETLRSKMRKLGIQRP